MVEYVIESRKEVEQEVNAIATFEMLNTRVNHERKSEWSSYGVVQRAMLCSVGSALRQWLPVLCCRFQNSWSGRGGRSANPLASNF